MATLILSTVGTALGGPVGGLIGTLVGQSIDQQLLGGGPRRGPRLGDLSVQTSSYGSMIPRVYGTMRVAGTVVWATDLQESSELQGDGKSQPETLVYSYTASFAVALSSRVAGSVRRIWADGKLIRGMAGDLKVGGTLRFHSGTQGQAVDPLIGSIEGLGTTPAYRGLALAVFEDLMLGDFGNRIPSLTFELVADADGVSLADILRDSSEGAVDCADDRAVPGYALYGADVAAAVAPLVEAFGVELHDDGEAFRSPPDVAPVVIGERAPGAAQGVVGTSGSDRALLPASGTPAGLTLTYHEASRDYQAGQARAALPSSSRVRRSIELPCVLTADAAKQMADDLLSRAWSSRDQLTLRLAPEWIDLAPGQRVRVAGIPGTWIVDRATIERMVVEALLRPVPRGAAVQVADGGRPVSQLDVVALPTRLALLDLSGLGDGAVTGPSLQLAAASPSGAYRAVPIRIEGNGVSVSGQTAAVEAIVGAAVGVLGPGQNAVIDARDSIEVVLANPAHWLQSCDDAALVAGANSAVIGDEMIQFGRADPIAPGRFHLSRLLRGRRGSEWAMAGHGAGEVFVMIDTRTAIGIPMTASAIGAAITVTAYGPGNDGAEPTVSRVLQGEATRPLSPAQLGAVVLSDGSVTIHWVRRSRRGWAWIDLIDVPADPDLTDSRISVSGAGGAIELTANESPLTLSAEALTGLGAGPLTITARQIGATGLSRPATFILNR